jgi:hypothetical protein
MRALVLAVLLLLLAAAVPASASGAAPDTFVTGAVALAGGAPLSGVNIVAQNATGPDHYEGSSDLTGEFSVFLPVGAYNVFASLTGYESNISYGGVSVGPEGVRLSFTMNALPGGVNGFVTNGTTPVYGATVQLSDGVRTYTANSQNPFGQYTISGMQPGSYSGQAFKLGYNTSSYLGVIVVKPGASTIINFSLEEQPASLTGRTTMADGTTVLEGVVVELASADFTAQTTSDAGGHYSLQRIPAGSYTLTYSKTGYQKQSYTMNFNPYETKTFDAKLDRSVTNPSTYLFGYDLAHSLMLVGLLLAILTMVAAIVLVFRLAHRPQLLANMEEDEPLEEVKKED